MKKIIVLFLFLSSIQLLTAQGSIQLTPNSTLYGPLYKQLFTQGKTLIVAPQLPQLTLQKIKQDSRTFGINAYLITDFILPGTELSKEQTTKLYEDQNVQSVIFFSYETEGHYDYTTQYSNQQTNTSASAYKLGNSIYGNANTNRNTLTTTQRHTGNIRTNPTILFYDLQKEQSTNEPIAIIKGSAVAIWSNHGTVRKVWKRLLRALKNKQVL